MSPRTILVIDDDPLVRWSLAQHLTQQGYRVVTAGSASEARVRAGAAPAPELILLDLKLPDMDGVELLAALRHDGVACPVIVLSAHLTPELSLKAVAAGATYVTEKPFQLETLHELVRRTVESAGSRPR